LDKRELYDAIAERKDKPADHEPYRGGNGRVDRCARLFRAGKLKAGGTLVDVGGGIGDLCSAVRDLFEERYVLDISSVALVAAEEKGHKTICCDVDRHHIRLPDSSVDAVTALDLIEHIIDPVGFAEKCFRVLKPGGVVFINTPNIRYWEHVSELLSVGRFPHTSGDREVFHGGHLAFFTRLDLQEIFGQFTKFVTYHDDECYCEPPQWMVSRCQIPKTREEYIQLMDDLGCPNLLFSCIKP
jgi:SAM-dependent methyltransferase